MVLQLRLLFGCLLIASGATLLSSCDSFHPVDERFLEEAQKDSRTVLRRTRVPIAHFLDESVETVLNPSGRNPLGAFAAFQTKVESLSEITIRGDNPVSYELNDFGYEHEVVIVGLYAGRENVVELTMVDEEGQYAIVELMIETEALPSHFPTIDVQTADRQRMEPGLTLSDFGIANNGTFVSYPFVFDDAGEIRWYLDLSHFPDLSFGDGRLANGNLIVPFGSQLFEYDLLGREINKWAFPGYWYHHDVVEMPNGNFLIPVNKNGQSTVEDFIIEIDRGSGAVVTEWDLREVLDVSRRDFAGTDDDWVHVNSVWYSEDDDCLIISGRLQGVFKVTRENELVWIFAPKKGWGKAGVDGDGFETADYLLTAIDPSGSPYPDEVQIGFERRPEFDWTWGQHAAMILPNGNLLLFDNGPSRGFGREGGPYSRGAEYRLDEGAKTVEQVWAFGRDRGADFFSGIISDIDYLPRTGNRLIAPGIVFGASGPKAWITEVTDGGTVVFDASLGFKNLRGNGGLVWGQFDLMYRASRFSFYPSS